MTTNTDTFQVEAIVCFSDGTWDNDFVDVPNTLYWTNDILLDKVRSLVIGQMSDDDASEVVHISMYRIVERD